MRRIAVIDGIIVLLFIVVLLSGASRMPTGMGTSEPALSRVLVIKQENATCIAPFVQGWNLISTYCEPDNGSIEAVFESINSSLISAHAYDPLASLDHWKAYNPSLPNWTVLDLNNITRTKGYWINMLQNDTLNHNGTWYSPTFVPLYEPVTLAGYPANITYDINLSLREIVSSVQAVYLYNASDTGDPWKVWNPESPALSDLYDLVPFYGLWFQMNDNRSWMVIWE